MHRFFLIIEIILIVIAMFASNKGHAFAPGNRQVMIVLAIAWLLIWDIATFIKFLLPKLTSAALVSIVLGIIVFAVLFWLLVFKIPEIRNNNRMKKTYEHWKEQSDIYTQKDLVTSFEIIQTKDSSNKIRALNALVSFKNDSAIDDCAVYLVAYLREDDRIPGKYTNIVFCTDYGDYLESKRLPHINLALTQDYKFEIPLGTLYDSTLKKFKEKGGIDDTITLDYAMYVVHFDKENRGIYSSLKRAVCFTPLHREKVEECYHDFSCSELVHDMPEDRMYRIPVVSCDKLNLNTKIKLEDILDDTKSY